MHMYVFTVCVCVCVQYVCLSVEYGRLFGKPVGSVYLSVEYLFCAGRAVYVFEWALPGAGRTYPITTTDVSCVCICRWIIYVCVPTDTELSLQLSCAADFVDDFTAIITREDVPLASCMPSCFWTRHRAVNSSGIFHGSNEELSRIDKL